jgi:hypothetical protein
MRLVSGATISHRVVASGKLAASLGPVSRRAGRCTKKTVRVPARQETSPPERSHYSQGLWFLNATGIRGDHLTASLRQGNWPRRFPGGPVSRRAGRCTKTKVRVPARQETSPPERSHYSQGLWFLNATGIRGDHLSPHRCVREYGCVVNPEGPSPDGPEDALK